MITTAPTSSASPANRIAAVSGLIGALRSGPPWSAAAGAVATSVASAESRADRMVRSPFPVSSYIGTVEVFESFDSMTVVVWTVEFESTPEQSASVRAGESPAGLRRRLKLAHVLGPVARQDLQSLPPGDRLAARAAEARLVEVRRAARRLHEPRVRLPHLGQELVEALVRVQATAHLVDRVGVGRQRPWWAAKRRRLDAPGGRVVEVDEVHQDVARLPPIDPRAGRPASAVEVRERVFDDTIQLGEERVVRGRARHPLTPLS